ncbi:hypothetical protein [Streptomyces sp. NPDC059071]|uniref:hypothetical protein n=1 Tax=unclassified Streptomyces TaxID=2593676 RepID=UPI003655CA82
MPSLDRETLTEIAEHALTRPADAYFWDDRLFTTHGAVLHWAELSGDLLDESNYLSALDRIRAAADAGRPDAEVSDEHVIDGSSRHFAFGSMRTIYVQVYEGGCPSDCEGPGRFEHEEHCAQDENDRYCAMWCRVECDGECNGPRTFTPAFVEAAEIISGLQDYPFVDESDHSERENARFQSNVNEALAEAQREYGHDSEQQTADIGQRAYEELGELYGQLADGAVDSDKVADIYREARNSHFSELANEHLNAPIAGQLALIAA